MPKKKNKNINEIQCVGEKNKKEALQLLNKYSNYFTEENNIKISEDVAYIKSNGRFTPVSIFEDNFIETIKNYLRNQLCILNI